MSEFSRSLMMRSLDESKRRVDFVASTDAIDSYDEVVEQDWLLERYLANPVVLYGHASRDLPIGKATRCEVVSVNGRKQLECTVQFATAKANAKAEEVWQSVLEGNLRAVSVGFRPGDYRFEKRDGVEVFVLSKNELLEISVVPIPANPEALAKMKAKAAAAAANEPPTAAAAAESIMTEKEMQERVAKADAARELAEKQTAETSAELKSSKAALEAAQGTITTLTADRDAHKARAEKAEAVVVEREVDELVGKKILPAEKETFLELRRSNPDLFKKMVEARPEMKLLGAPVIGSEPNGQRSEITTNPGDELAARAMKMGA